MRATTIIAFSVTAVLGMPTTTGAQEAPPTTADQTDRDGLLLERGTMQLGGMVGFNVTTWVHEGEDEHTSAMLQLAPQFGYFVADHLELLARLGFAKQLADDDWYELDSKLDFGFGIQYFAGDGPCAYFGALLGMEFWDVADDPYKWFKVTVPLGALIPLNRHVAVDVGARFSALVSLEDEQLAVIEVPMGFLGLQGFF